MHTLSVNLRLFFLGALLSYRALFRWLRPIQYLATKIWGPLMHITFFVLLGRFATGEDNTSFYVIGNAVQTTAYNGIYGVTMSITGDRWEGTLVYLFATPANRMSMFFGRAVMHIVDGMSGVFIGLVWGVLLFGLDLSRASPAALILTILITTFSTAGLGLLLGCLSLLTRNVMFVNNTVFFLLLVFSGANVPLEKLPEWALYLARLLPLTRGIEATRLIVDGASLQDVAPLLWGVGAVWGELWVGLFYGLIGYVFFRWFERQARRRGTLEAF
ncbi:MAG: ABC transporter permease [Anaerolineales bacterium]|nr:ABC transporter permease [Anaerolineales bacterium]